MFSDDDSLSSEPAAAPMERAEQRVAMLRELAELGMQLTRVLVQRAAEAPAEPEPRHNAAESFARVSRAVRLTLALEAKVDQDLAALRNGGGVATPPDDRDGPDDIAERVAWVRREKARLKGQPSAHRNKIRDNVWDVVNREVTDIYPAQEVLDDLHERLTEGERYDTFVFRPLRESVEAICADLGLSPDWSRWTDDGFPPDTPPARYDWPDMWCYDPEHAAERRRRGGAAAAEAHSLE